MTDVIAVPVVGVASLLLAVVMSIHAAILTALVCDDVATMNAGEFVVIVGGWFWWAFLLWRTVVP